MVQESDDKTNQVYMYQRRRMCWCEACATGDAFKCANPDFVGEWCGPHQFWDRAVSDERYPAWTKWRMDQVSDHNVNILPKIIEADGAVEDL